MDQLSADTAAVVRRVVRRTLTVVGGSVATTAIAWLISSSAAAADPLDELAPIAVPGLSQVAGTDAGDPVVPALSDVVHTLEQVAPVPPVGDLGGQATQAADEFGRRLADQIGRVPEVPADAMGQLGRGDRPGAHFAPGGGAHEAPSLAPPVGELSAAAPVMPSFSFDPNAFSGGSAIDRAFADGMTRRGSPEPGPRVPVLPVPVSVPGTGPAGGHAGGADAPTAAFTVPAGKFDLTRGQVRRGATARPAATPGAAPGTTPD